ncbi:MAG: CHASE3 domain-containing protein, partial [Jatrophihabitantaceae bacterium]
MAEAAPPRRFAADWSLRRRVGRASAGLLALLVIAFGVVVYSLSNFSARGDDVINRWQPAESVSQSLLADLVNQETGIRGYALGRSDSFLKPYRDYLPIEERHERALAGYVRGAGGLEADLTAFRSAVSRWRSSVAEPFIARVRAGDRTIANAATSDRAKAAFDRIRAAATTLTGDLRAVGDRAKAQRVTSIRYVWSSFVASAVLVLVAGFVVWRGLRKAVLEPVEALAAQAREVAEGS